MRSCVCGPERAARKGAYYSGLGCASQARAGLFRMNSGRARYRRRSLLVYLTTVRHFLGRHGDFQNLDCMNQTVSLCLAMLPENRTK